MLPNKAYEAPLDRDQTSLYEHHKYLLCLKWTTRICAMYVVSSRNCSQTTKEQANTISKVKLNKIGFRVLVYGFGFKNFISKEEINIQKLIQNSIMEIG